MIRTTLAAFILTFFSFSAQATLIQNGSFEAGPFLGPSGLIIVPKPSSPFLPSTAISGWNVTTNNVDFIQDEAFGLFAQNGTKMIDLTGGDSGFGTIEQMVALEIGKQYKLEFYIGGSNQFGASGDSGNPSVVVGLSGFVPMTFTGSRTSPNDWQLQSWTFVAAEANTLLSFTGMQTDLCCYIGLDNVRLVTEPATLALFGLGLAGLGLSRRKKAN